MNANTRSPWLRRALTFAACAVSAFTLASCQTAPDTSVAVQDNPERGRQGEILPGEDHVLERPYSKGVRIIGHAPIYHRTGNIQLAWIDHCAYVSSAIRGLPGGGNADETNGLAVIDVSNPSAPREVRLLRDHGALNAVETIHAVTAGNRKVLVAGSYAGGNPQFAPNEPAWLDIYDASDCTNPKLMSEYRWPQNSHTVTISADGRHVYGTNQTAFTGHGGVQVLDISDMAHPRFMGKFGVTTPDGRTSEFNVHELSLSPDERRIYAGVTDSLVGDLMPGVPEGPRAARLSPDAGGIYIIDNSDIAEGWPNPKMRLIGSAPHGGWHSVMRANIHGVPYLVGGGELVSCPGAVPTLTNIADEAHPVVESHFRLVMNHPENCPTAPLTGMGASLGIGAPSATLHYNDVDSAAHTRLGLFNFTVAGLRIADLADPHNPSEVAYFRPGDMCTGHVRYVPASGDIWLVCNESGFWVIRLAPDVRAQLARH